VDVPVLPTTVGCSPCRMEIGHQARSRTRSSCLLAAHKGDSQRDPYRYRWGIGTLEAIADGIKPALKGTLYFLKTGCFGGTVEGPRGPLVAALQALGATGIPDQAWASEREGGGVSYQIETRGGP